MGYGIVLHLDDAAVRAAKMTGAELGAQLREILHGDPYPAGDHTGRQVGPWRTPGSFHSTEMVALRATPDSIERVMPGDEDDTEEWVWQAQLRSRHHHEAARDLQRNPAKHAKLAARGGSLIEAYFGPDRSASSLASIWWFYADALRGGDPGTLGDTVLAAIDTYDGGELSVGSHSSAMNKLGALIGDGPVRVVWSGNRLCRPGELVPTEKPRWERFINR